MGTVTLTRFTAHFTARREVWALLWAAFYLLRDGECRFRITPRFVELDGEKFENGDACVVFERHSPV